MSIETSIKMNRLQLKKSIKRNRMEDVIESDDKESSDIIHYNKNTEEHVLSHGFSASQIKDDSLSDFKSPELKSTVQVALTNCKKVLPKSKRKVVHSKVIYKEKKKTVNKALNNTQPTIESSFFAPNAKEYLKDMKTAHVCALCFKTFKDIESQAMHMKSCAIKNRISTKQLLDVVQLQERQAAERKSLGLLAAPILQEKKKVMSRKSVSHEDGELELALALSKSLHEAEQLQEWNESKVLMGISESCNLKATHENHRVTLENFGVTSSRPICTVNKLRKKEYIQPTVLQIRTQEERDKLLTEKIANVLMEDEATTQKFGDDIACQDNEKQEIILKNHSLRKYWCLDNKLWDRTRLTPSQRNFYVKGLSSHITPIKSQFENMGVKQDSALKSEKSNIPINSIDELNEMQIEAYEAERTIPIENENNCGDEKFVDILVKDWGNALNSSFASDVIIFVEGGKYIWAHKLVFHIRCSNILLDIIPNDETAFISINEKICWTDITYEIAFAFLEYVYCGIISKNLHIFYNNDALSGIRCLARKYKVKDLFSYLRIKECWNRRNKIKSSQTNDIDTEEPKCKNDIDILYNMEKSVVETLRHNEKEFIKSSTVISEDTNEKEEMESNSRDSFSKEIDISSESINRGNSLSPDMFNDTDEELMNDTKNKLTKNPEDFKNTNLDVLISLIKQDSPTSVHSLVCSPLDTNIENTDFRESTAEDRVRNIEEESKNIGENNELFSSISSNECLTRESIIGTPRSSRTSNEIIHVQKQKSNLSLFIERIREENARTDFNSDSEMDSILGTCSKLDKNIVEVKPQRKSDVWIKFSKNIVANSEEILKRSTGLSMLEREIKLDAANNPEFYNITLNRKSFPETNVPSPNDDITKKFSEDLSEDAESPKSIIPKEIDRISLTLHCDNENENAKVDSDQSEEDISMYTKYKKKNVNNSIAKYRIALKSDISNNDTSLQKSYCKDNENSNDSSTDRPNNALGSPSVVLSKEIDTNKINEKNVENFHNTLDSSCITDIHRHTDNEFDDHRTVHNQTPILISSSPEPMNTEISEVRNFNKTEKSIDRTRSEFNDNGIVSQIEKSVNIRKLKVKSASEGNLKINGHKHRNYENGMKFVIVEKDVTSPPDYNAMTSPELHKEMKRYGLKLQKRSRAVKLLSYIYNELHPLIPVTAEKEQITFETSNSDNEPPAKRLAENNSLVKKQNVINDDYDCNLLFSQYSDMNVYSKKSKTTKEFKSHDFNPKMIDNGVTIKDVFLKLINNDKQLYNQILMYDPLNIETLHSTLKASGFKCKLNTLIDFLDEQCITFYLQENSMKHRTRKKS